MMGEKTAEFTRLLQESRQLNARIRTSGHEKMFLPQLQRGLEQIEELSSQLAAKVASAADSRHARGAADSKAALLLASKGYDASAVDSELRKIADIVPGVATHASPPFDADIETFLHLELDALVLETLDRMNKLVAHFVKCPSDMQAVEDAERIIKARQNGEWQNSKRAFFEGRTGNNLAVHRALQQASFSEEQRDDTQSHHQQNQQSQQQRGRSGSAKTQGYSQVVRRFNEMRLKGASSGLARAFETQVRAIENLDPRTEMLIDCWRALQCILEGGDGDGGEGEEENVFDNVFVSRDAGRAYLADLGSVDSKPWRLQLVRGSRSFLEKTFLDFVDRTLAQYPRDALLGGKPSAMERVRAFCDIKFKRLSPADISAIEVVNGLPIWMVLYHLVRCGLLKDALALAQSMEHLYQRTDPAFLAYIKTFISSSPSHMTGNTASQLRSEYTQKLASGRHDPYKMALLKVFGRCDLARKTVPGAITTSEDYVWLQLWLIEDGYDNDADGGLSYSLADLQRLITDFGPPHFDPKRSNPWHYFEILVLVGLFEKGIEYLYQSGQLLDAVHFAIVMLQAGTIRLAGTADPIFAKRAGQLHVNVGTLLTDYASSFGSGDALEAVNYLLLLSLARSPEYDKLCHTAVRDLILQSGDYASLLGDIRHDGSVMSGLLAQYARLMNLRDEKAFMAVITANAAAKCEQEGRFRESLQLYNLANKYDKVIEVLCAKLSRSFVGPYSPLECDELRRTTESILHYYASQPHIGATITPAATATCQTLLRLLLLQKHREDQRWAEALDTLGGIAMLPLDGDLGAISAAADRIRDTPDQLLALLPELLLTAMTVIVRRHGELGGYIGIDAGRAQQADMLKRMARNLMTFVGMLRLRVPQEVYAQLTRMEISIC